MAVVHPGVTRIVAQVGLAALFYFLGRWTSHGRDMINSNESNIVQWASSSSKEYDPNAMIAARRVWAFWFGPPMSGARLAAFEELSRTFNVELVTMDNLREYDLASSPMHPAVYENYLSSIHKGDYLRAYFMRHWGGGYHDIKPPSKMGWDERFDMMNENEDIWLIGVKERARRAVGCDPRYAQLAGVGTCEKVADAWEGLVSNGAYIMRPYSPLANDWFNAVHARLEEKYDEVKKHPAPYARCCQKTGTPEERAYWRVLKWTELHGSAFHPFQAKHIDHVKQGLPKWQTGESVSYKGDDEENTSKAAS